MKDYKTCKEGVIIRHDVDYSIDFAYELSRIEKSKNINATYFILLTTDFYNVFSSNAKKKIIAMINDGFEIGLHFDPTVYANQEHHFLLDYLDKEVETFNKFFDYEIKSYSMHNPSITGLYIDNIKLINAYCEEIFHKDIYMSDSSYSYRGREPREFLEKNKNKLVQYLTHPIHFFGNEELGYNSQIKFLLKGYWEKLDTAFLNIEKYRKTRSEDFFYDNVK